MATSILSLSDAKSHLGITLPGDDAALQAMIDAAAEVIESIVGPVDAATRTWVESRGGGSTLVLPATQVLSVTSLAVLRDGSQPLDVTTLTPDPHTGIVYATAGTFPDEPFEVTYTVGRTPVPAGITEAAKLIVQNWWQTRRGAGRPGQGGDDGAAGNAYLIPYRAEALLAPHMMPAGFA